jgi:hypothetical protein
MCAASLVTAFRLTQCSVALWPVGGCVGVCVGVCVGGCSPVDRLWQPIGACWHTRTHWRHWRREHWREHQRHTVRLRGGGHQSWRCIGGGEHLRVYRHQQIDVSPRRLSPAQALLLACQSALRQCGPMLAHGGRCGLRAHPQSPCAVLQCRTNRALHLRDSGVIAPMA